MDIQTTNPFTEKPNLELLTLEEAARLLKVDPTSVGRLIKRGELAGVKWGRTVRVRQVDLDKFISSHLEGQGS